MSEAIKHECGLAYVRLLKPLSYYLEKYGTAFYGLNKLHLLMEKQYNRGQDGAGIGVVKLDTHPGYQFLHRLRLPGSNALSELFNSINEERIELERIYPGLSQHPQQLKGYSRFIGEVMMGHLRYATQGLNSVKYCHPFVVSDINPARNLAMAGNFNLVNTEELFELLELTPRETIMKSDLGAMIETIHYFLCEEEKRSEGKPEISEVLKKAALRFDGGFVCGGLIGNGDSFILRDRHGIRPAYYFKNDEVIVAASERPAIVTAFNILESAVSELPPGSALIVKSNGEDSIEQIMEPAANKASCSFERIYFSRGNDSEIYKERTQLGLNLTSTVLEAIDNDLDNTVFSYVPNTAELSFYGLLNGLEDYLADSTTKLIIENRNKLSDSELNTLLHRRVKAKKVILKDVKMRTFIAEDNNRDELVQHAYDISYGTVQAEKDTLVVIDDSIVRGTTLKQSIIKMADRLRPKKIIVVSSSPQIRYPDCYGIDMSKMGDFIAFQAAIALLKDRKMDEVISETYQQCLLARQNGALHLENYVKNIYKHFSDFEISEKISEMLHSPDVRAIVQIIYQSIEGLHKACPNNKGDWYFTGNYPTPGGAKVANVAFLNYMENNTQRSY